MDRLTTIINVCADADCQGHLWGDGFVSLLPCPQPNAAAPCDVCGEHSTFTCLFNISFEGMPSTSLFDVLGSIAGVRVA